jgi:prepilin-type N-terminal cleavage/methylation domain-containing protein
MMGPSDASNHSTPLRARRRDSRWALGTRRGADGCTNRAAQGFTLVELLVSISIITLLASMILVALSGVQEVSRRDRTRAQVARIDALVTEKWESYRNRRIAISPQLLYGQGAAQSMNRRAQLEVARVNEMRQLMRMEMPDRRSDLLVGNTLASMNPPPALWLAYRRKIQSLLAIKTPAIASLDIRDDNSPAYSPFEAAVERAWTIQNQSSECLYLILSQMVDRDASALEFFRDQEIADTDNDGIPEILDGWGNQIMFVRWAPGLHWLLEAKGVGLAGGMQDGEAPDPFDLTGAFPGSPSFALYPLVASAGGDGRYGFFFDNLDSPLVYGTTFPPNNPFTTAIDVRGGDRRETLVGMPLDSEGRPFDISNVMDAAARQAIPFARLNYDMNDNITTHNMAGN